MKTKPQNLPVSRVTRASSRKNSLASSESSYDATSKSAASHRPATRLAKRTAEKTDRPSDEDLLNQFGCKDMNIVLSRCDGLKINHMDVPSPPRMHDDALRMPVIRLRRIDAPTNRQGSQPTVLAPAPPPPQSASPSAQAAHHVPVYKVVQQAISPTSSNANTNPTPEAAASTNVFDFMSMSQDDSANDDPMREVIEKLQSENRIELKRKKRGRPPGNAANSKPAMKQPRKTSAPSRVICSTPVGPKVAAQPELPNSFMPPPAPKTKPAVAVLPARGAVVRRNGPPFLLKKLVHQPTHQSTPIRSIPTAAAAADRAQPAVGGPSTTNKNSSPWRVIDKQVPSTYYFSASTGDQLSSFSGDSIVVSINVPASRSNTTAPNNKRPAEDDLATAMETQKRPKIASVAADAAAAEQQRQKRLNFSEVISPTMLEDHSAMVFADENVTPVGTDNTLAFASTLQPALDQHSTLLPEPSTSTGGRHSGSGLLNDSNTENIEPEHHAVQLAASKAKATRIVLGERCAVRSPLRPLAIRNVMLSPHANSVHSSSSNDESVVFGSPTPIRRLLLLSAQQRTPPPKQQPEQQRQPTADNTPPLQLIGRSHNATAIDSVSTNASDASTAHANEVPDANPNDENAHQPAEAMSPVVAHRKNLAECFGFDSESETEEAATGVPIRAQMVVNPFALRYKLKDLQKHRTTRRDSGPRRMLPPSAVRPKPSAIDDVQLFKDVTAAPKQTIEKSLRQLRQRCAAADEDSAAATRLQTAESTSRKSSMAPECFDNFARGLKRPNAPADIVEPVLFETRWPEQNNPNRKSYSRPARKHQNTEYDTSISDDDDDEDGEVDSDLSAGERAKNRRAERKARRKELEEAQAARELDMFADEFNSMCDEVDQFDVIMEKSA